jgi:hypothetical protein
VDLGPAEVQRLGDHREGGLGNVAPFPLHGVQDRQEGTLERAMGGDDLAQAALEIGVVEHGDSEMDLLHVARFMWGIKIDLS